MQVIIEGTAVDIDLPERDVTLRELVDEVEAFLWTVGKVPVGISIDSESLSQSDLEGRMGEQLQGSESVEFEVEGVLEFLRANMEGAQGANQRLLEDLKLFASEIHDANKSVDSAALVTELQEFFQFWIQMGNLLREQFTGLDLRGKDVHTFLNDMRDLLEEAVAGLEDDDLVLASDLIEYEIVPMIEVLDGIIPELKERVDALQQDSRIEEAPEGRL